MFHFMENFLIINETNTYLVFGELLIFVVKQGLFYLVALPLFLKSEPIWFTKEMMLKVMSNFGFTIKLLKCEFRKTGATF